MTTGQTEQDVKPKTRRVIIDVLLWFWWISWFGILGGFFMVGVGELRRELSQGAVASHFSLILLIIIALSWTAFFIADSKVKERAPAVFLLTTMGTILAVITILGIFFFVEIAPRLN